MWDRPWLPFWTVGRWDWIREQLRNYRGCGKDQEARWALTLSALGRRSLWWLFGS